MFILYSIYCIILERDTRLTSGTSMAAAHVAGAASLIFEKNPYLSNKKVREIMNKTAISLGDVFEYGNGKININAALYIHIECT
ncbi:S8 family serine peptidase [Bacillus mycoides]